MHSNAGVETTAADLSAKAKVAGSSIAQKAQPMVERAKVAGSSISEKWKVSLLNETYRNLPPLPRTTPHLFLSSILCGSGFVLPREHGVARVFAREAVCSAGASECTPT